MLSQSVGILLDRNDACAYRYFHVGFISAKIIKIMVVNYIVLFVYLPCIELKLKFKKMIAKEITFNQEAKDGILEGVNIVADAVGSTLGYRGKTVLIEGSGGLPSITKDGVSVAKAIFLEHPLASCGAELLKQAAQKTVDQAGDGTTTTTVLARDIIVRADEAIKKGASPIDVKNGIDEATKQIIDIIKKSSKPVVDDFFFDIANISANNDEELGGLISDAFLKAGKNGVVTYEASEKIESYVKTTSGMPIERGYTDDRFSNKMLDNPLVFVCNRELKSFNEIDFVIKHIATENKELLIISDLSNDLKQILLVNNIQGKIKVSHLTPPEHEYTDKRKRYMEDIAIATGATYIDSLSATHLESLGLTILGQVGKCNIGKEETVIELLNNTSEAIENRIDELNKSIDDQTSTLAVEIVKDRIAKLSSSISIVKVGGATEIELSEKLDRVEDAIHAVNSAIKEGVVSGGGLALYDASFKLDIPNNSKSVGYHVLQESIKAPFKKILDNANVDYKKVEEMLMEANSGIGYDVKKYDYANMIDSGIIDPARVVRCALENAVSVAGQVIQLGCTINFKRAL